MPLNMKENSEGCICASQQACRGRGMAANCFHGVNSGRRKSGVAAAGAYENSGNVGGDVKGICLLPITCAGMPEHHACDIHVLSLCNMAKHSVSWGLAAGNTSHVWPSLYRHLTFLHLPTMCLPISLNRHAFYSHSSLFFSIHCCCTCAASTTSMVFVCLSLV